MRHGGTRALPTVAVALALAGGCGGGGEAPGGASASCPAFPSSEWRSLGAREDEAAGDRRAELAAQLRRCHTLRGADRARVRRLLGSGGGRRAARWEYVLRPDYGADYELLVVSFGPGDRVTEVAPGQS